MKKEFVVKNENEMENLGGYLLSLAKPNTIIALSGSLGAGKTVLVKGLAKEMGINEPIVSPTFTLVQKYKGTHLILYHLDLYRLGDIDEFDLIDGRDILSSDAIVCIEWPDIIGPYLEECNVIYVNVTINADKSRTVFIETNGSM